MENKIQERKQNDIENIKEYLDSNHKTMLSEIQTNLPQIETLSLNFGKTQSQFMDNMLTVSHPTPIRNIRQILAEMNKSLEALKEAYFKNKKKKIEIKMLQRDLESETDELKKEMLETEIAEKFSQLDSGKKYVMGAIRKINNYNQQYNNILKTLGVKSIDEIDFESEEEQYHIKKAFEQALNAARSNGGRVDEGNQIYFTQIGINGTIAQKCVQGYLIWEEQQIKESKEPTAQDQWRFLEEMYTKFKGSAKKYAHKKGMSLTTDKALIGTNKQ
jgi:phosphopantetheinyl transferase (holo-ACP synthase)